MVNKPKNTIFDDSNFVVSFLMACLQLQKTMKKRIWFIINPISGVPRKDDIPGMIREYLNHDLFDFEIKYTQHKGHALDLAKEAVDSRIDIVCAVGGDGFPNGGAGGAGANSSISGTSTAYAGGGGGGTYAPGPGAIGAGGVGGGGNGGGNSLPVAGTTNR